LVVGHWPGPRPPWWDAKPVKVGEEIFAGLTTVNMAGRVSDPRISLALAKSGAAMVSKGGQEFSRPTGYRF
jgi:hypothetical protein